MSDRHVNVWTGDWGYHLGCEITGAVYLGSREAGNTGAYERRPTTWLGKRERDGRDSIEARTRRRLTAA